MKGEEGQKSKKKVKEKVNLGWFQFTSKTHPSKPKQQAPPPSRFDQPVWTSKAMDRPLQRALSVVQQRFRMV
ncbi:hypothetical protein V6N13_047446 [Hibiscus sabdariffa]|uniref:Uncharacterized protein n=1 Tax=Hibiscus sabdariffa TaxID=183260 RepID=A0ABR2F464_9ROSI